MNSILLQKNFGPISHLYMKWGVQPAPPPPPRQRLTVGKGVALFSLYGGQLLCYLAITYTPLTG